MGYQCNVPTDKCYWRETKDKYRRKINYNFYWTRYMTKNCRYLFRNNGNFAYNYKLKKYEHMSQTPMLGGFYYLQSTKKTYLSMSLNKKYFISYCCITIKKFSKSANTVIVWLKLKKLAFICNMCFKLLQNQDKINPQIHIIWTENQKYRVFTNFHHSLLDNLFRRENIKTNVAKFH